MPSQYQSHTGRPLPHLPLNEKPIQSSHTKFTQILQRVQATAELNVARTVAECKGDLSEAIKTLGSSLSIMVKTDFRDLDGENSPRKSKGLRQRLYLLDDATTSEETIRGRPDVSTITHKKASPVKTESDWFDKHREWEQAESGSQQTSWEEDDEYDTDNFVNSTPLFGPTPSVSSQSRVSHEDSLDTEYAFWSGVLSSVEPPFRIEDDRHDERPSSRQGFFGSE